MLLRLPAADRFAAPRALAIGGVVRRRPRASPLALALACAFALPLAACGGGGSSSGGGGQTSAAGLAAGTGAQGAANAAHWQVALAALAQPAGSPTLDDDGLRSWSDLIARSWPAIRTSWVEPALRAQLQQQIAALAPSGGAVQIQALRNLVLDLDAPPRVFGDPNGSALYIDMPASPRSWSVSFTVDAHVPIQTSIFGLPISSVIALDLNVRAQQIRVSTRVQMDLTDPRSPRATTASPPQLSLTLALDSASPLLGQVSGVLTQALDPVLRIALLGGAYFAQREITGLLNLVPTTPPGLGGPALQGVAGAPNLGVLADEISDEIQLHHFPYSTMLTVIFDQPGYGNGTPIDYKDFGDSAIWTGHYLASECFRFDLTGDPRALAGATKALDGLELCLDVPGKGGLLGRYAVPLHSPHGNPQAPIGVARGIAWNYGGHISRDQYIGAMLGFVLAYQRIPALKARAAALIDRMVDYLDRHDWNAYDTDGLTISAPFAQTPGVLWAFVKAGAMANPQRWGFLEAQHADMAKILWLADWGSTREVMESYYKFNLLHSTKMILIQTETDPARYREYVKALTVARDVVAHHHNAWFDSIWGAMIPAEAPVIAPTIQMELECWTERDRRSHLIVNSTDPQVAKVLYTSPFLLGQHNQQGFWISVFPLPIQKRIHGDFIWQTHPFQLDGGQTDPRQQHAGVDLTLPYWVGRAYGMLR